MCSIGVLKQPEKTIILRFIFSVRPRECLVRFAKWNSFRSGRRTCVRKQLDGNLWTTFGLKTWVKSFDIIYISGKTNISIHKPAWRINHLGLIYMVFTNKHDDFGCLC